MVRRSVRAVFNRGHAGPCRRVWHHHASPTLAQVDSADTTHGLPVRIEDYGSIRGLLFLTLLSYGRLLELEECLNKINYDYDTSEVRRQGDKVEEHSTFTLDPHPAYTGTTRQEEEGKTFNPLGRRSQKISWLGLVLHSTGPTEMGIF
ncbi:hypothetical protein EVAR_73845_1 [Eumeta japonica]|uniref:Uncharacterized protein n=1 Tax=Eumeta variegata TaxID=151549 RepID=A0A4C1SL32_EUMVA|nr:hypothetical protein EVAR_73845_1 [Eumeta japonica]